MLVPFHTLPSTSRIWIYQSNKEFSHIEEQHIVEKLDLFVSSWKGHGNDLKAAFQIKYNRFIVLAVDEDYRAVSGCAIDASVHFIQALEKELGTSLLNKMNIAFKKNNEIEIASMIDFKTLVKQEVVDSQTIVFNNMIQSKLDLETNWEVQVNNSWHKQFLA